MLAYSFIINYYWPHVHPLYIKIMMWMGVSILACFALCVLSICTMLRLLLYFKVTSKNCYFYVEKYISVPPILWIHNLLCRRLTPGCCHANNPWSAERWYKYISVFHLFSLSLAHTRENAQVNETQWPVHLSHTPPLWWHSDPYTSPTPLLYDDIVTRTPLPNPSSVISL